VAVGVRAGAQPGHPSPGTLRRPFEGLDGRGKEGARALQIERTPKQATKPPSGPSRKSPGSKTRWLIARDGDCRLEPLCVYAGTMRVLPVFSFGEEAEMFLRLGGYIEGYDGVRWRARESSAGELVSVLCGPFKDVKGVVLDPLPEMLKDGTVGLVRVGRGRFLEQIFAREGIGVS
jgi:hypothetical protein